MTRLAMPQLGESVTEGTIIKWLKQPGDHVDLEEPLVEIETEKVNVEMPSPYEGTLTEILVPEGETVSVGTELASIETAPADGQSPPARAQQEPAGALAASAPQPSPARTNGFDAQHATPNTLSGSQRYSPAVLQLSQQHQIDLSQVQGSGMGGRVTRKDVLNWVARRAVGQPQTAAAEAPALQAIQESVETPAQAARPPIEETARVTPPPVRAPAAASAGMPLTPEPPVTADDEEILRPSPTRRAIAQHMVRSVQTSPHAWMAVEIDLTKLVRLRESLKVSFREREGVDLSYLPFMIKATVLALKENPRLNASWREEQIVLKRRINIGIAVNTEDGLMVPVIHNADNYSIAGLARIAADLAARARSRQLKLEEVQGGTFTVDNTGVFGSIVSAPIINQPQAAIITMEAIVKRPVVVDDAITVRSIMNSCISFDHRVVDGGEVGPFMQALKRHLQAFGEQTPIY